MTDRHYRFSPNVWLRMTMSSEMTLDPDGQVFNRELSDQYVRMHDLAQQKQEKVIKGILYTDAAIAFLAFGKTLTIPFFDISLLDIPAALEAFTIASSFSFLMLSVTFFNIQAYGAAISVLNMRKPASLGVDPDFVSYSLTYQEWVVKLLKGSFNSWGADWFSPGRSYTVFYSGLLLLFVLSILGMVAIHFVLLGWAVAHSSLEGWLWWLFMGVVTTMSVSSVFLIATPSFQFSEGRKLDR